VWLEHHFQRQKVNRPLYSPPCWHVRQLQRWAWERDGRGKLLLHCRLLGHTRPFGAHGEGEERGHIMAAACLQLVTLSLAEPWRQHEGSTGYRMWHRQCRGEGKPIPNQNRQTVLPSHFRPICLGHR